MSEQKWTTEEPKEPGWYWALEKGEPTIYYFDGKCCEEGDMTADLESMRENWGVTHWCGPIIAPKVA